MCRQAGGVVRHARQAGRGRSKTRKGGWRKISKGGGHKISKGERAHACMFVRKIAELT